MSETDSADSRKIWYCGIGGKRIGPIGFDELQALARRGALRPSDPVWRAEFGDTWHRAEEIDGLFMPGPDAGIPPSGGVPPGTGKTLYPDFGPVGEPATPLLGVEGAEPSARLAGSRALARIRFILFQRPFQPMRWLILGLYAFLTTLGQGNWLGNIGNIFKSLPSFEKLGAADGDLSTGLDGFSLSSLLGQGDMPSAGAMAAFVAILGIILLVGIALGLVFCWIRARATFAFLHRIHRPDTTWGEAWQSGAENGIARSLFLWKIGFGAIYCLVSVAILVVAFPLAKPFFDGSNKDIFALFRILLPWLCLEALAITAYLTVCSFVSNFLEPVMFWRKVGIWDAWAVFNEFCSQCGWAIFRWYLLLQVWGIVGVFAILGLGLLSCGIYFLLLCIPVIGAAAALPVILFFRLAGLELLRQWRPDLVPPLLDKTAQD